MIDDQVRANHPVDTREISTRELTSDAVGDAGDQLVAASTGHPDAVAGPLLTLDFAGEILTARPGQQLTVGRAGDLVLDDNPYLHRNFLRFAHHSSMWWVLNTGSRLPTYLTDAGALMRSTLAPGAQLPLVFPRTLVTFAAGQTLYELVIDVETTPYDPIAPAPDGGSDGDSTIGPGRLTQDQLLALVALSEPVLKRSGSGAGDLPSTTNAAARLGWTTKRFDKKVENLCEKLSAAGVRGMRSSSGRAASSRRLHLVEYAVATRMVTPADLPMLDLPRVGPTGDDED